MKPFIPVPGLFILVFSGLINLLSYARSPLPDSLLQTLKTEHPRLLLSSWQEFDEIKKRAANDAFVRLSMERLLQNADSILTQSVVTYAFMDAFRMDTRNVNGHVYSLSMAYRLTGDKKYADRLWTDLEAVSRFPDWNPRHFLDCALMTHAIAIAYDWLYDAWTTEQRRILKQQLITKGLLEGLLYYDHLLNKKQFDWSAIEHNWNLVCNGNLALGALAIADEEPQLAARILRESLTRLPKAIRHFGPDGAWEEGPGYWSFAMRATVPILSSLKTALGTDFGLTDMAGFSKAGQFFVSVGGAGGMSFNYADASPGSTRSPELFWLANRFGQPKLAEMQKAHSLAQLSKKRGQPSPLELLWYKPQPETAENRLPTASYFRGVEVATLRSSWTDEGWFVGFKAGDNHVNHGHLDIGSYVLDYQGVRWIMDLGSQNYNVPGYFADAGRGGKRWTYYRTRAEGHNTLVINPGPLEDQDVEAKTTIDRFVDRPEQSFGIMDMTDAYRGKVTSAKRGIALLDRNRVLIQDEINASGPTDVYWFSHTQAAIRLSANGKKATLTKDGKTITAKLISPASAVFQVMEAAPLPGSPNPVGNNDNSGIQKIVVHLTGVKNATIAVEFTESATQTKTVVKPLGNW